MKLLQEVINEYKTATEERANKIFQAKIKVIELKITELSRLFGGSQMVGRDQIKFEN